MRRMGVFLLTVVALTTAAGCASGIGATAVNGTSGDGLASPPTTILDCRNQGSYNRATNLCVSNGP